MIGVLILDTSMLLVPDLLVLLVLGQLALLILDMLATSEAFTLCSVLCDHFQLCADNDNDLASLLLLTETKHEVSCRACYHACAIATSI